MGWVALVAGIGVERCFRLMTSLAVTVVQAINIRVKVLERVVMVVKVALDVDTSSVVEMNELEY